MNKEKIDTLLHIISVEKIEKKFPAYTYRNYAFIKDIYLHNSKKWLSFNQYAIIFSRSPLNKEKNIILLTQLAAAVLNPDMQQYVKKHGACALFFVNNAHNNVFPLSHPSSLLYWLQHIKKKMHNIAQKKLSLCTHTLFSALFLGKKHKSALYHKINILFREWGIVHLLARSGLHLLLYIILWQYILSLCGVTLWIRYFILFLLTTIFYMFTYFSISFARAYYMFLAYIFSRILLLPSDSIHIFSLITVIFLLYNPIYLFCLDFQLSFCLTGILIFYQKILRHSSKKTKKLANYSSAYL